LVGSQGHASLSAYVVGATSKADWLAAAGGGEEDVAEEEDVAARPPAKAADSALAASAPAVAAMAATASGAKGARSSWMALTRSPRNSWASCVTATQQRSMQEKHTFRGSNLQCTYVLLSEYTVRSACRYHNFILGILI